MMVTPRFRSWNQVVGFLTEWEGLRTLAAWVPVIPRQTLMNRPRNSGDSGMPIVGSRDQSSLVGHLHLTFGSALAVAWTRVPLG